MTTDDDTKISTLDNVFEEERRLGDVLVEVYTPDPCPTFGDPRAPQCTCVELAARVRALWSKEEGFLVVQKMRWLQNWDVDDPTWLPSDMRELVDCVNTRADAIRKAVAITDAWFMALTTVARVHAAPTPGAARPANPHPPATLGGCGHVPRPGTCFGCRETLNPIEP